MKQNVKDKRAVLSYTLVGAIIIMAMLCSFCVGKYPISLDEIGQIPAEGRGDGYDTQGVFTLRVPRTCMAILAGAGLGLAGAVYQIIFKNPLASPDIIGISSGANLGAAVAIVTIGGSMVGVAGGAFTGGLLAVLMVVVLVRATRSNSTSTYVLAGIIIAAVAKAFIMLLKYYADSESQLAAIEYWTMGSLASVTASKVLSILPFWLIGFVGLILLRRQVELLSLNEEECRALGVRLRPIRLTVLALSTLLVASVICVTGLISFVGLIAPHIAALMIKRQNTKAMILSSMVGGAILLISDILARTLYAAEIPISILTTIIGVPVLVWFMCVRRGRRV